MTLSAGQVSLGVNPDTRGFGARLHAGIMGESTGIAAVGKVLGGALMGGLAVVAAAGATAAGLAIHGGLSRALNIQDAKAQLTGLGNSTEAVTEIMNNALASVKGTSFGLDTAATIAASAVAAGIQPGKELERTLKLTADAATIAKAPLGEMGHIINQVAANQKLGTTELQMFQDRGVPLLQMVAKHYGITSAAASQMVTDGKVSFADFQDILQKGVGGAALSSGNTARGAFANIMAALSRLGAMFVGGGVDAAPKFFQAVAGSVDRVSKALTPVAAKMNEELAPAFAAATAVISKLDFGKIITTVSKMGDVFAAPQAAMHNFITGFTKGVDDIGSNQSALAHWGAQAYGVFGQAKTAAQVFFDGLKTGSNDVGGGGFLASVGNIGNSLHAFFTQIGPSFKELWAAIQPLVPQIIDLVSSLSPLHLIFTAIGPLLPQIVTVISELAKQLGGALLNALIQILPSLTQLAEFIVTVLVAALVWLIDLVSKNMEIVKLAAIAFLGWKVISEGISFAKMIVGLVASTAAWVAHTAAMLKSKAETLILQAMYAKDFIVNLAKSVAGIAASTAAWIANTAAQVASKAIVLGGAAAMGIATAAQWLFNAAMNANPIVLVVIGIVALVAAIIWVATQTTFFQDAWKVCTDAIGVAWDWLWNTVISPIVGFFVGAFDVLGKAIQMYWTFYAQPIITAIAAIFTWLWNSILSPILEVIALGFVLLGLGALWLWDNAIMPAIHWIADAFTWLWNTVIKLVVDLIVGYFQLLGYEATWLWENAIQPAINAIGDAFNWIWNSIIMPVVNFIVGAFNWLGDSIAWLWNVAINGAIQGIAAAFDWIWNSVISPVIDFIVGYFQMLGAIASWLWNNAIMPAINGIGAVFQWLWNSIIMPISDWITGAIHTIGDTVSSVFGAIGGAIRGAFEGVVGFIRGVINGVIDVINGGVDSINGLVDVVNSVPGAPHFDRLGHIPHLATGGTIRTPGVALVGENGPEVVSLPAGATVYPNGTGPSTQGGGVTFTGPIHVRDEEELARIIVTRQRDAQMAYGF